MANRPEALKPKTLWDEWQETVKSIEIKQTELAQLKTLEQELSYKMFQKIGAQRGILITSPRLRGIMKLLAEFPGIGNKEIANRLNITERTVKFHMSNLLRIYGVTSRTDLYMRFINPTLKEVATN